MTLIIAIVLVFTVLTFIISVITKGIIRLISLAVVACIVTVLTANLFSNQASPLPELSSFNQTFFTDLQALFARIQAIFAGVPIFLRIILALIFVPLLLILISTRKVNEGNEALVERLGRYHRKLSPGFNSGIIPFVDEIVVEASVREQILEVEAADAITKDNVTVQVSAATFWKIFDLRDAYYAIEDVEKAIENLVTTTLRSEIGDMTLQEMNYGRDRIMRSLLERLDEATEPWGVKVTRVEILNIQPPDSVKEALEKERQAESEKRAAISRAEGRRYAMICEIQGVAESIQQVKQVLPANAFSGNPQILVQMLFQYFMVQQYAEASHELGKSANAKVVFIDPKASADTIADLLSPESDGSTSTPTDSRSSLNS